TPGWGGALAFGGLHQFAQSTYFETVRGGYFPTPPTIFERFYQFQGNKLR
ncbi:MAG: hypothetical protein RL511_21, partial [Bacteroidota bacterium]